MAALPNSYPKWITSNKQPLGTINENEYYEYQLDAYNPQGASLTYTFIAGKMPPGIQLHKSGLIHGIPVITNATKSDSYRFEFTVRVINKTNAVADKTFSISVNNIVPPQIIPTTVDLGSYFLGNKFTLQLQVVDPNPQGRFQWSLVTGQLPPGVTLDKQTGLLNGYLMPRDVSGDTTYTTENHRGSFDGLPYDLTPFSPPVIGVDPLQAFQTYTFDVEVFDGNAADKQRYSMKVYAKSILTIDNTSILVNGTTGTGGLYTADMTNQSVPILLTQPEDLPSTRQNSNFAFRFAGIDLDGDIVEYRLVLSGSSLFDQQPTSEDPLVQPVTFDSGGFDAEAQALPPGLTLDETTGWLTGNIGPQVEDVKTYKFSIYCIKQNNPTAYCTPVEFTLTVLGDLNNIVVWESPEFLGTMYNGGTSEFRIKASTPSNKILLYTFESGEFTEGHYSRLPQGLTLLENGLISGRASFRYFEVDDNNTTFDKGRTTFDSEYTFTIRASDEYTEIVDDHPVFHPATISSAKTFTIKVVNRNERPYENLWLRAFPTREQRYSFNDFISDQALFPSEMIYRQEDPHYGKIKDIKFLFLPGLSPAAASKYISSMSKHHYTKRIELGNVKTAVSLDEDFNVKYEVVYVEVADSENYDGKTPTKEVVDLSNKIRNPYIDEYMQIYKMYYPNDFYHMQKEVIEGVGFTNKGALPDWMTCPQPDGRVLGFTRAVVLAYTVPGASKLIAFRIKDFVASFDEINFMLDRYQLDNSLTKYYDIEHDEFDDSEETTFDRLDTTPTMFEWVSNVQYAVTVPFDDINGRTTEYIERRGGIDGTTNYKTGDLLVFARQESFAAQVIPDLLLYKDSYDANNFDSVKYGSSIIPFTPDTPVTNEGWNINLDLYNGDNPFDSQVFNNSLVVPGYLENFLDPTVVNQRMGVWEVNIINGVVYLRFVQPVLPYQFVTVTSGNNYRDTKIYYDPIIKPGFTVPQYSILTDQALPLTQTTRFDQGSTKFIDNRDQHTEPGNDDKYIKFPKTGIFN